MWRARLRRSSPRRGIESASVARLIATQATYTREVAGRFGVIPDLHPEDMILRFLLTHPAFSDPRVAIDYYFADGRKSADSFHAIVQRHMEQTDVSVLEFASGFGCVSRHLKGDGVFRLMTAADIHPAAVKFLQQSGIPAVLSAETPELAWMPTRDVVFALSFFSHMPEAPFARWLRVLGDAVAPGGLLVFTTHGRRSIPLLNLEPDSRGYAFRCSSEQLDLDPTTYGLSVTTMDFVLSQLVHACPSLSVLETREGFWWEHQDLYVLRREVDR